MKITCFADDPGGANGIISFASIYPDARIIAEGASKTYIPQHGLKIEPDHLGVENALLVGATSNSESASYNYIMQARANNIPSFAYIDAAVNADMRFKGLTDDPLHYATDYLFVNEPETANNFNNLGFKQDHIYVVGNPRYDFVCNRFQNKSHAADIDVLFLADPLEPRIGLNYKSCGFNAKSVEDVRSFLLLDILNRNFDFDITIKLHPRNSVGEYLSYQDQYDIYQGNDLGIDLAFRSKIVIGTTTSLLVEASLIGVPCIAVLLDKEERKWLPQIIPDNLIVVEDTEELKEAIKVCQKRKGLKLPDNRDLFIKNAPEKMLQIIKEICEH